MNYKIDAPLFCRNPFQARLCRRRPSTELIRCLRLSVRWISTLKKFPGALQREMRCLHAGGQLCECFPDVCTYYLYANPSPSADGRSASIEREKYIYIIYLRANFWMRSQISQHRLEKLANSFTRKTRFRSPCEWAFAWPERMFNSFYFVRESACSQAEKRKCSVINHRATTNLSPGFNFNAVRVREAEQTNKIAPRSVIHLKEQLRGAVSASRC